MAIVKHVAEPATFSEIIREVGVTAEDMRIVESVYRERKSGKTKKAAAKKATGKSVTRKAAAAKPAAAKKTVPAKAARASGKAKPKAHKKQAVSRSR